jgi:hypothetical protein
MKSASRLFHYTDILWCTVNRTLSASCWFHYTDILWCTVNKTLSFMYLCSLIRPDNGSQPELRMVARTIIVTSVVQDRRCWSDVQAGMPHIKIKVRYFNKLVVRRPRERSSAVVPDTQQVSVRCRRGKEAQIILSVEGLINTGVVHRRHQDKQHMNTNVNKFTSAYPGCINRV